MSFVLDTDIAIAWLMRDEGSAAVDPLFDTIVTRHGVAVEANTPTYVDPVSGFSVFTAAFLARRGECCESGCRHCPWIT